MKEPGICPVCQHRLGRHRRSGAWHESCGPQAIDIIRYLRVEGGRSLTRSRDLLVHHPDHPSVLVARMLVKDAS